MDTLRQDLRYGVRVLARSPGFTSAAVLTLAVGIGATTVIFSFVNAVLVRPLPFPESDRLAMVQPTANDEPPGGYSVTPGDFVDWQEQNAVFEQMAAFTGAPVSLTGVAEPERLFGATVTRAFFPTIRVAPMLGRGFDAPGADVVAEAVISEALWRRRFAADRGIIGRVIALDRRPFTVVGVMAADFTFPSDSLRRSGSPGLPPIDVWTGYVPERGHRNNALLRVVGRLKPGVTLQQAEQHMNALAARIAQQLPQPGAAGVRLEPLHEQTVADVRQLLYVFFAAAGLVLLIACVNVANLLLARAATRAREVAVRTALGSSRWRLVRQLMTESLLLALLGGAGGVFVALWGVDLALAIVPAGTLPRLREAGFDSQTLAFALALSILSALAFGLTPALHASGASVVNALKGAADGVARRLPFLDLLVVAEVALAFVLLVGAGLLVRSFVRLTSVDPGFAAERTLTLSVALPEGAYQAPEQMNAFIAGVVERLAATRGVVHAGAVNWLPLGHQWLRGHVIVEGAAPSDLMPLKPAVTSGYFQAIGIPLVRGRTFSERDTADAPGVAIVTERLARTLWPGQDAVGKRLKLGFGRPEEQPWLSVIGIVGDVKSTGLGDEAPPAVYVPVAQAPRAFLLRDVTFVLRTAGEPLTAAAAARAAVRRADPNLPIASVATMESLIATSVSQPRFRSTVLSVFAGAALVLVATGILGVIAYAVSRRTREIGVRIALGAQRADVLHIVVRHALTLTLAGVVLGACAAVAATRALARFLFAVEPTDAATFVAASVLLLAVAMIAIYVPARRALSVDPLIALRAE